MLAIRVALRPTGAAAAPAPVIVFDEVDAGIGGEAGAAVGQELAALARGAQVLCVTHLAQVAAFADTQIVVAKSTAGGRTRAGASVVDGEARVTELSRMLAGDGSSEHARRHAEELLGAAAGSARAGGGRGRGTR
jgi:DNA repair protein RecN (Recombination protein N)